MMYLYQTGRAFLPVNNCRLTILLFILFSMQWFSPIYAAPIGSQEFENSYASSLTTYTAMPISGSIKSSPLYILQAGENLFYVPPFFQKGPAILNERIDSLSLEVFPLLPQKFKNLRQDAFHENYSKLIFAPIGSVLVSIPDLNFSKLYPPEAFTGSSYDNPLRLKVEIPQSTSGGDEQPGAIFNSTNEEAISVLSEQLRDNNLKISLSFNFGPPESPFPPMPLTQSQFIDALDETAVIRDGKKLYKRNAIYLTYFGVLDTLASESDNPRRRVVYPLASRQKLLSTWFTRLQIDNEVFYAARLLESKDSSLDVLQVLGAPYRDSVTVEVSVGFFPPTPQETGFVDKWLPVETQDMTLLPKDNCLLETGKVVPAKVGNRITIRSLDGNPDSVLILDGKTNSVFDRSHIVTRPNPVILLMRDYCDRSDKPVSLRILIED